MKPDNSLRYTGCESKHPARIKNRAATKAALRHITASAQTLIFTPERQSKAPARVACHNLYNKLVPYQEAWGWQQELVVDMLQNNQKATAGHLLILQHPSVLTLGAGSTEDHLKFDPQNPPFPLHRTERGGEVTYHGPGQLVLYPILNLRHFTPDLHWFMRSLEEVVIRSLKEVSNLGGARSQGQTGVWVGDAKIAAIGIRARRWVTYHGMALNVTTDLSPYDHIVPCGIADKPVTSIMHLLGEQSHSAALHCSTQLLQLYAESLLSNFEQVFNAELTETAWPLADC